MVDSAREALQHLLQQATARGMLIEVGWLTLQLKSFQDLPKARVAELRAVFFAGAGHLFKNLIEARDSDIKHVAMIESELKNHTMPHSPRKSRTTTPRKRSR